MSVMPLAPALASIDFALAGSDLLAAASSAGSNPGAPVQKGCTAGIHAPLKRSLPIPFRSIASESACRTSSLARFGFFVLSRSDQAPLPWGVGTSFVVLLSARLLARGMSA